MKALTKSAVLAGIIGIASLMSVSQASASESANPATCNKCTVAMVTTPERGGGPGKMGTYYAATTTKVMSCPDCHSALANLFLHGTFKHSCESCADTTTCDLC